MRIGRALFGDAVDPAVKGADVAHLLNRRSRAAVPDSEAGLAAVIGRTTRDVSGEVSHLGHLQNPIVDRRGLR